MGWGKQHLTPSAIAVCVLCLTLSWTAWDMDRAVHREIAVQNAQEAAFGKQLQGRADALGLEAKAAIDGMNGLVKTANDAVQAQSKSLAKLQGQAAAVLDHVNRNCGTKVKGELAPCGTLADVGETLKTYRHTATLINVAAKHEDTQLGKVDVAIGRINDLLASARVAVDGLAPLEKNLTVMIAEAQPGVTSMDHMLATADQVEMKGTKDYLHPSKNPIKRTWKTVEPFLLPGAEVAGAIAR